MCAHTLINHETVTKPNVWSMPIHVVSMQLAKLLSCNRFCSVTKQTVLVSDIQYWQGMILMSSDSFQSIGYLTTSSKKAYQLISDYGSCVWGSKNSRYVSTCTYSKTATWFFLDVLNLFLLTRETLACFYIKLEHNVLSNVTLSLVHNTMV